MARYPTEHGFYELNPFPGCNQLVVSNHAFVEVGHRGVGLGNSAHQARLYHIKTLGYDAVVCTCVETNYMQIRILNKNGWHRVFRFFNRETGNWVGLWVRGIEQPGGESKLECQQQGEDQGPRTWTAEEIESAFRELYLAVPPTMTNSAWNSFLTILQKER